MNDLFINLITGTGTTVFGLIVLILTFKGKKSINVDKKKRENEEMIKQSKKRAEEIIDEAKKQAETRKEDIEEETQIKNKRIKKIKQSLDLKEEALLKRQEKNRETEEKIKSHQEETERIKNTAQEAGKKITESLSKKANKSVDELNKEILTGFELELKRDNKKRLAGIEEITRENAKKEGANLATGIMQRLCSPTSVETRVVMIKVPKDHIKGKIVGKEGRNMEELEKELDVAVVFNDLPNTISISAFNLVVRRIAEKTIEKLIKTREDIIPDTIRKTIKEAEKETDEELYEIGKKAVEKMGIESQDKEFMRTVGRLQYRTSYGQNIMKHSMEVGWIAAMLGSELGLNVKICKTAGFLHDLGKAIDQDPGIKDAHDQLTKELMGKYGFSNEEIHAAWAHHDAEPQKTPEALAVKAADAISGGRPGARQDSIERYMERMQAIDDTVAMFKGIKKSYTMSAGREVRVFVDPEEVNDKDVGSMAKNIAQKIEENVTYPGKIKINVIRRTKSLEIAK